MAWEPEPGPEFDAASFLWKVIELAIGVGIVLLFVALTKDHVSDPVLKLWFAGSIIGSGSLLALLAADSARARGGVRIFIVTAGIGEIPLPLMQRLHDSVMRVPDPELVGAASGSLLILTIILFHLSFLLGWVSGLGYWAIRR